MLLCIVDKVADLRAAFGLEDQDPLIEWIGLTHSHRRRVLIQ